MEPALGETEKALGSYPSEESEWHWRFRMLKAEILVQQRRNTEALALASVELPDSLATSDLAVWRNLTQASASAFTGRRADADRFLAEAEGLAKAHHPELLGQVALRKGTARFLAGDIAEAEATYRQTLQFARQERDLFLEAAALGSLGLIATRKEHYDESIDWNRAALSLSRSIGAQVSVARVLGNTAWSYKQLGDFENALALYRQAVDAFARIGLVAEQTYWLTGISNVYYLEHDYSNAESVLSRALDLARSQGNPGTIIEYLTDLSEIALHTGQIDLAEKYFEEASRVGQTGLDPALALSSMLVQGRIDQAKHNFAQAERSFQHVIRDKNAESQQRWEAEARLAKVYADEGLTVTAEKEFRRSLGNIETVRSSVHTEEFRLSFLSGPISFYDDYIEFLISQRRVQDALQVAELSRARTLAEGLGTAPKIPRLPLPDFHPRQIARRLKSVVLFYWLGQKKSYLWVITPSKVNCFVLAAGPQIDLLVKSYRGGLLSGRDVLQTGNPDGKKLYEMLIEPAKKLIPTASRVIVLPDGSLYGLNFETLLIPEPEPHFWIEDATVLEASSLSLLASPGTESVPKQASLLLVGNAAQATNDFPSLRQAPAEVARVQEYFPQSRRRVLAGMQATPSAFLASKPEQFAYLHFVTHGTASRTHPLDSAVILSPEGDSFKLYARDIVKHHLSAYLVTVSACNGLGIRAYSGEGLVGLSWAFLRAGAHNVIAALWEVSDTSTPQLMDKLYAGLTRGQDPAAALRAAKLSLLHCDCPYSKPYYWAPFQLYAGP